MPRKKLRSIPDAVPDRLHDLCGDLCGSLCVDEKTSGEINFRVMRIRSGGSGLQQPSSEEIRIPSNNSKSPRERNSYSVKIRWALDKR